MFKLFASPTCVTTILNGKLITYEKPCNRLSSTKSNVERNYQYERWAISRWLVLLKTKQY